MAFLQLRSKNPDFSFVIQKNPSTPMIAKKLRKGVAYGYYDEEENYNIYFQDAFDEISFSKSEEGEFEYLDETRYDSPLFLFAVLRDFFGTALSRLTEKDTPYDHELFLPSLHIAHGKFTNTMDASFEKFGIHPNDVGITFYAKETSMHEFLNYVYAYCALNLFFGKSPMFFEESIAKRVAVAMNIIKAPYLPRYLAKMLAVRSKSFDAVKEELSEWEGHSLQLDADATAQEARITAVSKQILPNTNIIDFGAGDGQYLFLSRRLSDKNNYFAIDRDEKARQILERKAQDFDGKVHVLENVMDVKGEEEYTIIISEVIEHNTKQDAKQIILRHMINPQCKRLIITTPNATFNANFPTEDEFRHPDHQFELTQDEFHKFISHAMDIADPPAGKLEVEFFGIGDVVDGEPVTQMAVITRMNGN